MANTSNPEIWYPGGPDLADDYPDATTAQLVEMWSDYSHGAEVWPLQGVYGVYSVPSGPVKAIASIDVCEVLRDTSIAFMQATGLEPHRTHDYTSNTWIVGRTRIYERQVVTDTLRLLMSQGLVSPVENSTSIGSILRSWRQQGIYVAANTSTLPGCESGTIKHTLGRDYPDCFDAIVFPRNYDGKGAVTKATALDQLAIEAGLPAQEVPIIHIDDAAHHIRSFLDMKHLFADVTLYVPEHDGNRGQLDPGLYYNSPLDAFLAANKHFKDRGVIS